MKGIISYSYMTQYLWMALSLILIFVFILNKTQILHHAMRRYNTSTRGKLFLAAIFGFLGMLGTYFGITVQEGIANTRAVGVIVGGLIGGPVVGIGSGIIAGLHRFLAGSGVSAAASGSITVLQGILSGMIHVRMKPKKEQWRYALAVGIILESLHMLLLMILVEDKERVANLVINIAPAMMLTNPIGIAAFIALLEDAYRAQEKTEAFAAKLVLSIANKTTSFLGNGLNEQTALETANIIYREVESLAGVGITSRERMLAFVVRDKRVADTVAVSDIIASLPASCESGIFQAGKPGGQSSLLPSWQIAMPLTEGSQVIGSLVLYKRQEHSVSLFETELARGLANLMSTQLAISKGERQAKLLASAEVKALQAQINPHFLFNALNTISYYCRKQPDMAKRLINHLGNYYRNHLAAPDSFVTLSKELRYVDDYIKIEMARFEGRLKISLHIESDCETMLLPPLILQPLVENAVKHGLVSKDEGGEIRISSEFQPDGSMKLSVEDNGVGMEPAYAAKILEYNPQRTSIGLSNVHRRLIAIYGPDCGLNIVTGKGQGLKVSFIIPQRKELDICR
ncbi:LytS/YhcK type 5TM receptor domain-containing protein [Acetonema longum]|uniref:Signal transduction histidine kinase, LytS n=1 Tax=Acetonema longum DSM 6540 TaxID=1009370 RepID=F7NMM0_9FIRM|nr:LytS/YhcK type 5TM receptor domain-containing protein [Acetonema longum]EGO62712.1 signal transduction histidine kinase, LytS [Acetonema longum DSM 6540]